MELSKEETREITEDGSELHEIDSNRNSSIRQVLSDEADNKPNKDSHSKEYNKEEPTAKRDARNTADISEITFDVTVSGDANEKLTVLDSINLEGVSGRSNPLETSHHERIGNSGLEPEGGAAKDNTATGLHSPANTLTTKILRIQTIQVIATIVKATTVQFT